MNTFCELTYLNQVRPGYPVESIPSLFLPRFNNYQPDALASLDAKPNMPYQVAPMYVPSPKLMYSSNNSRLASALPSGVANFDRSAIRQFNPNVQDVYPYMYANGVDNLKMKAYRRKWSTKM